MNIVTALLHHMFLLATFRHDGRGLGNLSRLTLAVLVLIAAAAMTSNKYLAARELSLGLMALPLFTVIANLVFQAALHGWKHPFLAASVLAIAASEIAFMPIYIAMAEDNRAACDITNIAYLLFMLISFSNKCLRQGSRH